MLELMPPFYFLLLQKSRYQSRKNLVSKKSRYRSRKHLVSKKSLGISIENIWSRKKSRYRSRKYLVSKKVSVSVSKIFGLEKSLGIGLDEIFWSCHSVLVCAKTGSEGGKKCHRGKNIVSSGNVCTAFLFILGHSRPRAG